MWWCSGPPDLSDDWWQATWPVTHRVGCVSASAGRSEARLEAVRTAAAASTWPLVLADSTDAASLVRLANAARVVLSTVGPYRRHGLALFEACAKAGTHYADLAGELLFMRESIDRYGAVAAGTGARIIHCCGVDSVPPDLGVLLLHRAAAADGAGDLEDTTLLVKAFKGGVSGGTLATMTLQLEEVSANSASRALVDDPYALSPDRVAEPQMSDKSDLMWIRHDGDLNSWIGPFAMAGVNTQVVRRSNALQGWAYGRRFRYREVTHFGSGAAAAVKASAAGIGLLSFRAGSSYRPTRVLLDRVLPAPGAGPNEKARQAGSVRVGTAHRHVGWRTLQRPGRSLGRPGLYGFVLDHRRGRVGSCPGPGSASRGCRRTHPGNGVRYAPRRSAQSSGRHHDNSAE